MSIETKKIEVGSLVGLKTNTSEIGDRSRLWIKSLFDKRGPYRVCAMIDPNHVTLENQGKIIYFGSTGDPSLHISYVEPWKV